MNKELAIKYFLDNYRPIDFRCVDIPDVIRIENVFFTRLEFTEFMDCECVKHCKSTYQSTKPTQNNEYPLFVVDVIYKKKRGKLFCEFNVSALGTGLR